MLTWALLGPLILGSSKGVRNMEWRLSACATSVQFFTVPLPMRMSTYSVVCNYDSAEENTSASLSAWGGVETSASLPTWWRIEIGTCRGFFKHCLPRDGHCEVRAEYNPQQNLVAIPFLVPVKGDVKPKNCRVVSAQNMGEEGASEELFCSSERVKADKYPQPQCSITNCEVLGTLAPAADDQAVERFCTTLEETKAAKEAEVEKKAEAAAAKRREEDTAKLLAERGSHQQHPRATSEGAGTEEAERRKVEATVVEAEEKAKLATANAKEAKTKAKEAEQNAKEAKTKAKEATTNADEATAKVEKAKKMIKAKKAGAKTIG